MSSHHAQLRADLATAITSLKEAIDTLVQRIRDDRDYPAWAQAAPDAPDARNKAISTAWGLHYLDGQDPHETIRCTALIGASAETLACVESVNQAKQALQTALHAMDGIHVKVQDPATGEWVMKPLIKIALASLGHPRLHRRQATRRLEILERAPSSASFTWARLRKVQRITVEEARAMLQEQIEKTAGRIIQHQRDLDRLQALQADEPLAIVEAPHLHPKVNLAWVVKTEHGTETIRGMRRAVVPIFYPSHSGAPLPRLRPLPEAPPAPGSRLRRSDVLVEDEPFLPSIHIHRYREGIQGRRSRS